MKYILLFSPMIFVMGCASNYGRIKDSIDSTNATIEMGQETIHPGDQVKIFDRQCQVSERRVGINQQCSDKIVGQAEVVEIRASSNEATIRAEPGTKIHKNFLVKKVTH